MTSHFASSCGSESLPGSVSYLSVITSVSFSTVVVSYCFFCVLRYYAFASLIFSTSLLAHAINRAAYLLPFQLRHSVNCMLVFLYLLPITLQIPSARNSEFRMENRCRIAADIVTESSYFCRSSPCTSCALRVSCLPCDRQGRMRIVNCFKVELKGPRINSLLIIYWLFISLLQIAS